MLQLLMVESKSKNMPSTLGVVVKGRLQKQLDIITGKQLFFKCDPPVNGIYIYIYIYIGYITYQLDILVMLYIQETHLL